MFFIYICGLDLYLSLLELGNVFYLKSFLKYLFP